MGQNYELQLKNISFIEDDFIDTNIFNATSAYLTQYKVESRNTLSRKISNCYIIKRMSKIMFGNVFLGNINQIYLVRKLVELESCYRYGMLLYFSELLFYMIHNNILKDANLYNLSHLESYFYRSTVKSILKILGADNFKKYEIIVLKNSGVMKLFYINIDSKNIRDIVVEFLRGYRTHIKAAKNFCAEFCEGLSDVKLNDILDLNYSTFVAQLNSLNNKYGIDGKIGVLVSFYIFVYQKYNQKLFEETNILDAKLLLRQNIASELILGYKMELYNPTEDVPQSDKWILNYASINDSNSSKNSTSSITINFTKIKSKKYRDWAKFYIWTCDVSIYNKIHSFNIIVYFLNYITDLKSGEILSILARKTDDETLTLNEMFTYKNHVLSTFENNNTAIQYIYKPRSLLTHLVDTERETFGKDIFYYLTCRRDNRTDNAEAISNHDLEKLASLMKKNALEYNDKALYYSIFYIALETEFRASQINTLTFDCVKETDKPNQFVIDSKTKTSSGEILPQPITIYVKKHIDSIIKLTNEYRKNCKEEDINKLLFILPAKKKNTYGMVSTQRFNSYFKNCCRKLEIKEYTIGNLRDTHMTKAEEWITRNAMSDMEQKILTNHQSPNTTTTHYIDTQITELLESVHGIIIGNVDLKGKIVKEINSDISTEENKVSNECGYCGLKDCDVFTYIDCMMCEDFVTTISRIPYFEEQIRIINKRIVSSTIKHDKEDFVNIKILMVGYLKALMILKETKENE